MKPLSPLSARVALFVVLILAVGGAFTLDRVHSGWPAVDLRWVGLAVAVGCWSIDSLRHGRARHPGAGGTILALGLWVAWLCLAALWTAPGARLADAISSLIIMWVLVVLAVGIVTGVEDPSLLIERLWTWILVIALLYFLAAAAAGPGAQGRFSAFGGGPNVFVRIMAFGLLACVALARRRTGVIFAAPLLILGAVLSGSRGGLLALVVVGAVVLVPTLRRLPPRVVIGGLAAMVVAAGAALVLVADLRTLLTDRFLDQTVENRYGSGRGEIFDRALHLGLQHPWVGAGLDSYYAQIGQYASVEYPHNLVLATFAYGGVIGVGLLLLAVAVPTVIVIGSGSSEARLLAAAGWYVILAAQFSGDLYDSRFAWIFLALAAAVAASRQRPAREEPRVTWWADDPASAR